MARTLMTVNYCNFQYFNRDCDRIYRPGGSGDYLFLLLHSEMAFRLPEGAFQNRPGACLINTCGGGEITIRSRPYDHAIQRQPCPL